MLGLFIHKFVYDPSYSFVTFSVHIQERASHRDTIHSACQSQELVC